MTTPQEPTQMTAPTREQVIQMAADAGFVGYGEDVGDYSIPAPAFIARLGRVIEAARAQALDEAAGVCATERAEFIEQSARNDGRQSDMAFGSVNSSERIASAIQALKGKP